MTEFKKVAIFFDKTKEASLKETQESRIDYFQELANMYKDLNTGVPLQKDDLKALVETPKEFIAKALIKEESISIGGLNLNFDKMFDIIEKPIGTDELIRKIVNDAQIKELMITQRNVSYFEIENNDTVVLNAEYIEQIKENSTVYLTTENQQKAYNILTEIAEKITELKAMNQLHHLEATLFDQLITLTPQTGIYAVNPYFGHLIR